LGRHASLVDVTGHGGDAVRGLVVLGELALGGELAAAVGDGRAVGVEVGQCLRGGGDAGLVEGLEDGVLGLEHRVLVGDLDLEGESGLGAGDDCGVHGVDSQRGEPVP
jgi:hypothetical protein